MNYLATSINESPVIVGTAAEAIEDVRGRAVKFDENGTIVLAGTGDAPLGIGIMTSGDQGAIAAGEEFTIQFKAIGLVYAGGAIKLGAGLAVGANGAFTEAGDGTAIATALEAAAAEGQYIKAILKF